MALNLITKNSHEFPTCSKMNELWAEADLIVEKAMDGKSLWFLEHPLLERSVTPFDSDNEPFRNRPWRGMQFWDYTKNDHTASASDINTYRRSFIHGMHIHSGVGQLPNEYDETLIDTALSSATFPVYDLANKWAQTASGDNVNLSGSLKVRTTTISGTVCNVWDYNEPSPDKIHSWAVAELMIENHSGTYTLADTADKYNFFKIHNLKNQSLTFNFGAHHQVVIPAWGQACVRRDSVSTGYDSSYKYFFKCEAGDPRWFYFDSHGGLTATGRQHKVGAYQSMRANNVCNASFLHSVFEGLSLAWLIDYDAHTLLEDVTAEYRDDGHIPSIVNSITRVADLVYLKGNLRYIKRVTSGGVQTNGLIEFDGFGSLNSQLSTFGINANTSGNNIQLTKNTDYLFLLYGLETNFTTYKDRFRVLDLGTNGDAAIIQTEFQKQPERDPDEVQSFSPYFQAFNTPYFGSGYVNHTDSTTTVGLAISNMTTASQVGAWCTVTQSSALLTTEGPVVKWSEEWKFGETDSKAWTPNVLFHLQLNQSKDRLTMDNFHPLAAQWENFSSAAAGSKWRYYSNGWPNRFFRCLKSYNNIDLNEHDHNHHHRLFEGPRKTRRYEDSATHLDFTDDPVKADGTDIIQNKFGTFESTNISVQSCDFRMEIDQFSAGATDKKQIPRCIPNDPLVEIEENRLDKTWTDNNIAAIRTAYDSAVDGGTGLTKATYGDWSAFGGNHYLRMNLLKEHYNDLARWCKAAKRFNPFDITMVRFPEVEYPFAGYTTNAAITNNTVDDKIYPIDSFAGWLDSDSDATKRANFWAAMSVAVRDKDDYFDSWDILISSPHDPDTAWDDSTDYHSDFKWVKIADVKSAAATYNFKIKRFLVFEVDQFLSEHNSGVSDGKRGFHPKNSGNANYKIPLGTGAVTLCGGSFSNETTSDYDVLLAEPGARQWERQGNLKGHERYYVECIDTSNTGSTKATVALQIIEDSGGPVTNGAVTYQSKTAETFHLSAPAADKKYRVLVKPFNGVTHNA